MKQNRISINRYRIFNRLETAFIKLYYPFSCTELSDEDIHATKKKLLPILIALGYSLQSIGRDELFLAILDALFYLDRRDRESEIIAAIDKFRPSEDMKNFLKVTIEPLPVKEIHMQKFLMELLFEEWGGEYIAIDFEALSPRIPGEAFEALEPLLPVTYVMGDKVKKPKTNRDKKKSGSFYTPKLIVERTVSETLTPLVKSLVERAKGAPTEEDFYNLRIIDPAMGCGFFLIEAAEFMAKSIFSIVLPENGLTPDQNYRRIRREVIARSFYGIELNPAATVVAQLALWGMAQDPLLPISSVEERLVCGDALKMLTEK